MTTVQYITDKNNDNHGEIQSLISNEVAREIKSSKIFFIPSYVIFFLGG